MLHSLNDHIITFIKIPCMNNWLQSVNPTPNWFLMWCLHVQQLGCLVWELLFNKGWTDEKRQSDRFVIYYTWNWLICSQTFLALSCVLYPCSYRYNSLSMWCAMTKMRVVHQLICLLLWLSASLQYLHCINNGFSASLQYLHCISNWLSASLLYLHSISNGDTAGCTKPSTCDAFISDINMLTRLFHSWLLQRTDSLLYSLKWQQITYSIPLTKVEL